MEKTGGGSSRLRRIQPFINFFAHIEVDTARSARKLPNTGGPGIRQSPIFEGRFDKRQEGNFPRNTLFLEDSLESLDIASRPDHALTKSLPDSNLGMDVVT